MYNSSSGAKAPRPLFCVSTLCELQSAVFCELQSAVFIVEYSADMRYNKLL